MFKNRTLLDKLKKQHPYLLESLPERIGTNGADVAIEDATLWIRSPSPSSPSKTRSGPSAAA